MRGGGGRGSGVRTGERGQWKGRREKEGERSGGGDWRLEGARWRAEGRGRSAHRAPPAPAAGYRASVTLVQKGCWTGPPAGQMQSNEDALPPDYSVIRGCTTDWCNADYMTHDTIPNLSPGVRGRGGGAAGRLLPAPWLSSLHSWRGGRPGAVRDPHHRGGTIR